MASAVKSGVIEQSPDEVADEVQHGIIILTSCPRLLL